MCTYMHMYNTTWQSVSPLESTEIHADSRALPLQFQPAPVLIISMLFVALAMQVPCYHTTLLLTHGFGSSIVHFCF